MKHDELIETGLFYYDVHKRWYSRGGRMAARRAIEWAYDQGRHDAQARCRAEHKTHNQESGTVKVVLQQHKPLVLTLLATVVSAIGSAGITTASSGWIAGIVAVGVAIVGAAFTWLRAQSKGGE